MIGMSSRYLTEKAPHHYNMIISKFTIRHKLNKAQMKSKEKNHSEYHRLFQMCLMIFFSH